MQKTILYLLLFIAALANAQNSITYTTKDGLPSNFIYDIVEDRDGFMWFATNRGVSKFDGETFKNYTTKQGLPNNDTWRLHTSRKGKVWYASKSKYQGYIYNDSIHRFKTKKNDVLSPSILETDAGIKISSGNMYELQNNELITHIDIHSNSVLGVLNKQKLSKKLYSFIPVDKNKIVLITSSTLKIVDTNHTNLKSLINLENVNLFKKARNRHVSMGLKDSFTFVWSEGIIFYNLEKHTYTAHSFESLNIDKAFIEGSTRVYYLENEIQLKIGSTLFSFDYTYQLKNKIVLPQQNPSSAFIDSNKHLWVTSSKGVSLYTAQNRNTTTYINDKAVQHLGSINNQLLASTFKQGFYSYSGNDFVRLNEALPIETTYNIEDLAPHTSSFLLNGIQILETTKDNPTAFKSTYVKDPVKLERVLIKDITLDEKGNYLAINSGGIAHLDFDLHKIKLLVLKQGLLQIEKVQNDVYVGGSDGVFKILGDSIMPIHQNENLLNASVLTLANIEDRLFIGTDGNGAFFYDNKLAHQIPDTDGLSIKEFIKEQDTLWLATNKGVKKLLFKGPQYTNSKLIDQFYQADGLLDNNVNDIFVKDNSLFAATDAGISEINTHDSIYGYTPNPYFKTKNDTLRAAYSDKNDITVAFGSIAYGNSENISFQYRLTPNQSSWTATETTAVTFSNLDPGTHVLEIKATNQHFKTEIKSHYIIIEPLWWQTVIAKVVFALLGILGLVVFGLAVRNIIKRKEQDKNERDKRVAGLELQALRSQMNPHFVHNSLNAIQYYIQRNEVELSENYLSKFSKLIRMFFEYSRKETLSLKEEIDLLEHYLQIEKLRFEDKLNYTIETDPKLDLEEQVIPSMILQPIVENAVNHGIFHKTESGSIKIQFKVIKNGYQVLIEDDGIGINKAKEIYKTSTKNYRSKSSAVLQERLELLNQSNQWNIQHTIVDISDVSEKQGTRVTLIFKTSENE